MSALLQQWSIASLFGHFNKRQPKPLTPKQISCNEWLDWRQRRTAQTLRAYFAVESDRKKRSEACCEFLHYAGNSLSVKHLFDISIQFMSLQVREEFDKARDLLLAEIGDLSYLFGDGLLKNIQIWQKEASKSLARNIQDQNRVDCAQVISLERLMIIWRMFGKQINEYDRNTSMTAFRFLLQVPTYGNTLALRNFDWLHTVIKHIRLAAQFADVSEDDLRARVDTICDALAMEHPYQACIIQGELAFAP